LQQSSAAPPPKRHLATAASLALERRFQLGNSRAGCKTHIYLLGLLGLSRLSRLSGLSTPIVPFFKVPACKGYSIILPRILHAYGTMTSTAQTSCDYGYAAGVRVCVCVGGGGYDRAWQTGQQRCIKLRARWTWKAVGSARGARRRGTIALALGW
jgi:hypothetical protein